MTEFMLKTDTTTSLGVQEPEVAFSETIWNKKEPNIDENGQKWPNMAKNDPKWPKMAKVVKNDQKW